MLTILGTWVQRKDYSSIARQLPAILNVLQLFDEFRETEQISNITQKLQKLKEQLTSQLIIDLKATFQVGKISFVFTVFQAGQLNERVTDMCRVAAALESGVRENLCKWFIDQQLAEYIVLFAENEEGAWIDKIDERYITLCLLSFCSFQI